MRRIIVGLTHFEARNYAMLHKEAQRGCEVRLMAAPHVIRGALRGLRGDDIEVVVLPRAWTTPYALPFGLEIEHLEQSGIAVRSLTEAEMT